MSQPPEIPPPIAAQSAIGNRQSAILARCQRLVERVLAAQGDQPEPELIQLQHDLTELTR